MRFVYKTDPIVLVGRFYFPIFGSALKKIENGKKRIPQNQRHPSRFR